MPQFTASCAFVVAGIMSICYQAKSDKYDYYVLGVKCGMWRAVFSTAGACGFVASAALYFALTGQVYSVIALLVGALFFLIGSLILWLQVCMGIK